jgi:hypothetical protein
LIFVQLAAKYSDLPVPLPEFDIVPIDKLLRGFKRVFVVVCVNGFNVAEATVFSDDICAVIWQAVLP